jgi:protoheme IX farnesyltransferase
MSTTSAATPSRPPRAAAYLALTKPDVSFLVLITAAAGYYLGAHGPVDWLRMGLAVAGTGLVAAGTAALNHYLERDSDAQMRRTASRPLPSGALLPREALWFGCALLLGGYLDLYFGAGGLSSALGIAASLGYLLAYTPLKRRTVWATVIGALPGAAPPMMGWAAARGSLDREAWLLFAILFLWQFPHFDAIAWMYRRDYARAGIRMLPVVDGEGNWTFRRIVLIGAVLIPVSLLPAALGFEGMRYFFGALLASALLFRVCVWAATARTVVRAKWLMHATVAYIPLLFGLMMYDKLVR